MIGVETALADDPELTCRLPGLERRSPMRVVFDSGGRMPPTCRLARGAREVETILLTANDRTPACESLRAAGVRVFAVAERNGRIDAAAALRQLGELGITRLLVEGGAALAAGLIVADRVDRLVIYRAPMVVGGDGRAAIAALGLSDLLKAPRFSATGMQRLGPDVMESYRRSA